MRNNAQFARYVSYVVNLIGRTSQWPRAIQRAFFSDHMNNQQRFKVIVFLLNNGVPAMQVEKRFIAFDQYDDQAIRHVRWVINEWTKRPNRWQSWNILAGRSI